MKEPTTEQVEELSEKFHEIYQVEAKRQGDVRHHDDYADLSENIKEFDRVLARFVLRFFIWGTEFDRLKAQLAHTQQMRLDDMKEIGDLKAEVERLKDMLSRATRGKDRLNALREKAEAEAEHRADQRDAALESVGLLTAEVAALRKEAEEARPLLELLVEYAEEALTDHLHALGETTEKNRGTAGRIRKDIADAKAALAYRAAKEPK